MTACVWVQTSALPWHLRKNYLFYRRYVDDILTVFESKESAMQFFNRLNTLSNHTKFTFEQENHGKIVFLDVELNQRFSTWGMRTPWGTFGHLWGYAMI